MSSHLSELFETWRKASNECSAFHVKHEKAWTPEINHVYAELHDKSEKAWVRYVAARTNSTLEEVEAAINESMHSRYD